MIHVVGDLLRGCKTVPRAMWGRCPECGRRGYRCTARLRLGYRYFLNHWWQTRDLQYRRVYKSGRPAGFNSTWDARKKVDELERLATSAPQRKTRAWARRHLAQGRLP